MSRADYPTKADAENVMFQATQDAVIVIGLDRGRMTLVCAGVDRKRRQAVRELTAMLAPLLDDIMPDELVRRCRVCGCTAEDCSQCVAKTGHPCTWVALDLCSACVPTRQRKAVTRGKA